ncbi:hypothetical protein FKP32DRAFT_1760053 [Trametes sanguinea]|nr:hypothetical protein FKP32DRAFT_1760053 [Trametes sanguinea]
MAFACGADIDGFVASQHNTSSATSQRLQGHSTEALRLEERRIEREIDDLVTRQRLLKDLANMRTALNEQLAVYRIPDELLVGILHLALGKRKPDSHLWDSRKWWTFNVVCRRWRDVICSTASFWCILSVDWSLEWVNLSLHRSQSSPLTLYVDGRYRYTDYSYCVQALQTSLSRVRSLSLTVGDGFLGFPSSLASTLLGSLAETAVLEKMTLSTFYSQYSSDPSVESIPRTAHWRGLLRNLRSLELDGFDVPRQLLQCRDLRAVKLVHSYFTHTTHEQLLVALSSNASLEELHVEGEEAYTVLEGHSTLTGSLPRKQIVFPRLRSLRLLLCDTLIQYALHTCCFPKANNVQIAFESRLVQSGLPPASGHGRVLIGEDNFSEALAEPFPLLSHVTAINIPAISSTSRSRCNAVWATTPDTKFRSEPLILSAGHNAAPADHGFYFMPFALRSLALHFASAPVTVLVVKLDLPPFWQPDSEPDDDTQAWTSIFRAFHRLRTLVFEGETVAARRSMWEGLSLASRATAGAGAGELCCPHLSEVALGWSECAELKPWQPIIGDVLSYRARRGQRLETLRLKERPQEINGSNLAALTSLVQSLVWGTTNHSDHW